MGKGEEGRGSRHEIECDLYLALPCFLLLAV